MKCLCFALLQCQTCKILTWKCDPLIAEKKKHLPATLTTNVGSDSFLLATHMIKDASQGLLVSCNVRWLAHVIEQKKASFKHIQHAQHDVTHVSGNSEIPIRSLEMRWVTSNLWTFLTQKMLLICQMVLMLYSIWLPTRVFAEFREHAFSNIFKGFSCDVVHTLLRFFHDNGYDIATGC